MLEQLARTRSDPRATLKAVARIFVLWRIGLPEAAQLAGMTPQAWKAAKTAAFSGDLTEEQAQRLAALLAIWKGLERSLPEPSARVWMRRANSGAPFGGKRPVDSLVEGGLPALLGLRARLEGKP